MREVRFKDVEIVVHNGTITISGVDELEIHNCAVSSDGTAGLVVVDRTGEVLWGFKTSFDDPLAREMKYLKVLLDE